MVIEDDRHWFLTFSVESNDRPESDIVWTDAVGIPVIVRTPTRTEKLSILLIGAAAIGFIVVLVVTLIVAVYISRH